MKKEDNEFLIPYRVHMFMFADLYFRIFFMYVSKFKCTMAKLVSNLQMFSSQEKELSASLEKKVSSVEGVEKEKEKEKKKEHAATNPAAIPTAATTTGDTGSNNEIGTAGKRTLFKRP